MLRKMQSMGLIVLIIGLPVIIANSMGYTWHAFLTYVLLSFGLLGFLFMSTLQTEGNEHQQASVTFATQNNVATQISVGEHSFVYFSPKKPTQSEIERIKRTFMSQLPRRTNPNIHQAQIMYRMCSSAGQSSHERG
mgnify:CR=1 FL=1